MPHASQQPESLQCPTQNEIPREFNDQLVRELASLKDLPRGFAASSIALFGFGSRGLLEKFGLIELRGNRPAQILITERGWQVIAACADFVARARTSDWQRCRDLEADAVAAG